MNELTYYVMCFIFYGATAYPIRKIEPEDKSELRDEKRYPNGTVVGKYTYKDLEGNPVHVKYFADDSSYGVELKSFKVIDSNYPVISPEKQSKSDYSIKTDIAPNTLNTNHRTPTPDRKSDFEIFMENELKPEKCGNEKIRVYYDKNNKRKIRNIFNPYETLQFCKQF